MDDNDFEIRVPFPMSSSLMRRVDRSVELLQQNVGRPYDHPISRWLFMIKSIEEGCDMVESRFGTEDEAPAQEAGT